MEQRTCNIIMCCKGHCNLPGGGPGPLEAIAAYMSNECGCPARDYKGHLMETILREAMFDYMATADKPAADLRNLFYVFATSHPPITERICSMFSLTNVWDPVAQAYCNGFTDVLVERSRIALGENPEGENDSDDGGGETVKTGKEEDA